MTKKPIVEENEFEEGKSEEDVYTEKGREELMENDEISDTEEGFVQGFEEQEKVVECTNCKKILVTEDFVEEEIDGDVVGFCSDECAEEYVLSRRKKEKK